MRSTIKQLEDEAFWEDDSILTPPDDIFAFNELRSCADLYRMYTQGILDIQPEFQRDFVWKNPDQTRFIDSLVKQLPIPSLCFSYDSERQKWLVIDGLQRISTIIRFLKGDNWKLFSGNDITPGIAGINAASIKNEANLNQYYSRVENSTIPITVLRCNYSNHSHLSYLFTIFHRLNSSGMKLNNQEIRNCIYSGTLNRRLRTLDELPAWRKINKMKKSDSYRLLKQELILRIITFVDGFEKYTGSLTSFLNEYMATHRFESEVNLDRLETNFKVACDKIYAATATSPLKPSITVLEAIFVAALRNMAQVNVISIQDLSRKVNAIVNSDSFSEKSLAEGLAKKTKLIERLTFACDVMAKP